MGRYILIQDTRLPFDTADDREVALTRLEIIGPFLRIAIVWRDEDGVALAIDLIRLSAPHPALSAHKDVVRAR